MAFIYKQKSGKNTKKQIGLAVIVAVTLWMMLKTGSKGVSADSLTTLITVLASVIFFVIVAFKKNPLNGVSFLGKKSPGQVLIPQLMKNLEQLEGGFHVFPGITLEFFKIDCLVVSAKGIFVVRILEQAMDKDTGQTDKEIQKLWQRCHMINMLIKKGYKKQIMPIPLLAIPGTNEFTHKGVAVMPPEMISGRMSSYVNPDKDLNEELAQSFSIFLSKRYLR